MHHDQQYLLFRVPTFEFDGHTFPKFPPSPWYLPWVYLAAKARRGDETAIQLLTGAQIRVYDHEQKQYWPMPEQADGADTPVTVRDREDVQCPPEAGSV